MPIIQIATLDSREGLDKEALMRDIIADIKQQLGWPGNRVVVYFNPIAPGEYLFAEQLSDYVTEHSHHPMVYLHYVEGKPPEVVRALTEILVSRLSAHLHIARENVCVIHVPVPHGSFYVHDQYL